MEMVGIGDAPAGRPTSRPAAEKRSSRRASIQPSKSSTKSSDRSPLALCIPSTDGDTTDDDERAPSNFSQQVCQCQAPRSPRPRLTECGAPRSADLSGHPKQLPPSRAMQRWLPGGARSRLRLARGGPQRVQARRRRPPRRYLRPVRRRWLRRLCVPWQGAVRGAALGGAGDEAAADAAVPARFLLSEPPPLPQLRLACAAIPQPARAAEQSSRLRGAAAPPRTRPAPAPAAHPLVPLPRTRPAPAAHLPRNRLAPASQPSRTRPRCTPTRAAAAHPRTPLPPEAHPSARPSADGHLACLVGAGYRRRLRTAGLTQRQQRRAALRPVRRQGGVPLQRLCAALRLCQLELRGLSAPAGEHLQGHRLRLCEDPPRVAQHLCYDHGPRLALRSVAPRTGAATEPAACAAADARQRGASQRGVSQRRSLL